MTDITPQAARDEWVTTLVGQALLFGLLGKALYANPDRAWLEPLVIENVFEEAPFAEDEAPTQQGIELLARWTTEARGQISDAMLRDLRADYAHLFVGESRMSVPPWESVYFNEERLIFQEETVDVRRWFERFGVKPQTTGREPEDHIAFELSFIGHLAERSLEALEQEEAGVFSELLASQRVFLSDHLLRWGLKWAELAYEQAETDFYRGLIRLTAGGLQAVAKLYETPIPQNVEYPGLGE